MAVITTWGVRILAALVIATAAFCAGRASVEAAAVCLDLGTGGCLHWRRDSDAEVVIPVDYHNITNPQQLAQAANGWSAVNGLRVFLRGPVADANVCHQDQSQRALVERGTLVWCGGVDSSAARAGTSIGGGIDYGVNDDPTHSYAVRIFSDSTTPTTYVLCHEMGHGMGLNHGGDGCMGTVTSNPGSQEIALLNELYAHAGTHPTPTPVPTATATQAASPTATLTPTPTQTPRPSCWPPKAKRCR